MFKILKISAATAVALLISTTAFAQQMPQNIPPEAQAVMRQFENMSPAEQADFMQKMMKGASTMQACLDQLGGPDALEDLKQRSQASKDKVGALCAAGKRAEAQKIAIAEGKEIAADKRMVQLKECSKDVLDSMPQLKNMTDPETAFAKEHACDILTRYSAPAQGAAAQ